MTLDIVVFGLAITSSWGNGHAATYRALLKALSARGHTVMFLERDVPWYRDNRDLDNVDFCQIELYQNLREVARRFGRRVAEADLVIIGSYVPEGLTLADWITTRARGVTAFYDIDTPVTMAGLETGTAAYISAALIPRFDLYLSFTGGPLLNLIEERYGSRRARALYCSAEFESQAHVTAPPKWALGYLGTYSADRQAALEQRLLDPARQLQHESFVVAGAQYPENVLWPANVTRVQHLPPKAHPSFYSLQRYTLNVTRADMITAGYSPSVRLFEAAACGVPVITDRWPGLETAFTPDKEILIADSPRHVVQILEEMPEERRRGIAAAAHMRLLKSHMPQHRAKQLEDYYSEVVSAGARPRTAAEIVA